MNYLIPSYTSCSSILRLTEGRLIDMATGGNSYSSAISSFFSSSFDTTDVSRPHGYLVWMLYDNNMKLVPAGSGAKRVTDPNDLEELIEDEIPIAETGYLHVQGMLGARTRPYRPESRLFSGTYVTNGSAAAVSFDNFLVTYIRGKTRQINHYYPYGLSIDGLDHSDEYLNKYTSKELQTGEFDSQSSSGLEMFDFGSRFYDPQVGRWFTPDPAEQFHNPYLAMGNNPVMYVDPDGEWIQFAAQLIFSGVLSGIQSESNGSTFLKGFITGAATFGYGSILSNAGLSAFQGVVANTVGNSLISAGGNAFSGDNMNFAALGSNLAVNIGTTAMNVSYQDKEIAGVDEFGVFELTNYRLYEYSYSTTVSFSETGWTFAGSGGQGGGKRGKLGKGMPMPRRYSAKFSIDAYAYQNLSTTPVDGSEYYTINQSYRVDVIGAEYTSSRDIYPNTKFKASSELSVNGQKLSKYDLTKARDGLVSPPYNYVGSSSHLLPEKGVAQIRLQGSWLNNGRMPLNSRWGITTLGIDQTITLPGRPW